MALNSLMSLNVTVKDQYPNRTPLNLSLSLLLQPWGLFVSLFHESQICEGSIRYTGIQSIDSFLGVGTSRMNKITELGS